MNYNVEHVKERGYWYDVVIKKIKSSRRGYEVIGDVYIGINGAVMRNCNLVFLNDIYAVKPYQLISERTSEDNQIMQTKPTVMSNNKININVSLMNKLINVSSLYRSWSFGLHRLQR